MKKPLLYIIPFLFFCNPVFAEKERWQIYDLEKSVHTCIPGGVTHGDGFCFRMEKGYCDFLVNTFTTYTISNHKNIGKIEGKIFRTKQTLYKTGHPPTTSATKIIKVLVTASRPFLMGYRVAFDMGVYDVDQYLDFFKEFRALEITILGSEDGSFIAKDYFELPYNNWTLENLNAAIEDGQKVCRGVKPPTPGKDSQEITSKN